EFSPYLCCERIKQVVHAALALNSESNIGV
ncbi:MAG: hypothetical protein ACI85V_001472, partial [bacterium]